MSVHGSSESEFYVGQGFDRLSGPGAGAVHDLDEQLARLRRGVPRAGNLYAAAVRADFPGNPCLLPINWLLHPERHFDYVLLRGEPGQGFPTHVHGYGEEIYLVIAGEGVVLLDGEEHTARKHDIFHIPAGVPHGYRVPETATEPFDLFVVNAPAVSHRNRSRYWAADPVDEAPR